MHKMDTPVDEVSQGGLLFFPERSGGPWIWEARATAGRSDTCYLLPATCADCEEQGKDQKKKKKENLPTHFPRD